MSEMSSKARTAKERYLVGADTCMNEYVAVMENWGRFSHAMLRCLIRQGDATEQEATFRLRQLRITTLQITDGINRFADAFGVKPSDVAGGPDDIPDDTN